MLSFLRHRNFPAVKWKNVWAQGRREPPTFRLWSRCSTTAPLKPCIYNLKNSVCFLLGFSGRFFSYRKPNFPAVSGSYLPGFSGRICSYWQPNFPAVSGSYLPGFSGCICSYLPGFSGLTFFGTRRPVFSGRICCFWPGFSGRSFSGMGNLKKLYGQQANCSGIYSGNFCP